LIGARSRFRYDIVFAQVAIDSIAHVYGGLYSQESLVRNLRTDQGETMRTRQKSLRILALTASGLVARVGVARAQLTTADVGVNPTYRADRPDDCDVYRRLLFRPRVFHQYNGLRRGHVDLRRPGVAGDTYAWLFPTVAHLGRFKYILQWRGLSRLSL
jgi:hypothetical protein